MRAVIHQRGRGSLLKNDVEVVAGLFESVILHYVWMLERKEPRYKVTDRWCRGELAIAY